MVVKVFNSIIKLVQALFGIPIFKWMFWNIVKYVLSNKLTIEFVLEHKKKIVKEIDMVVDVIEGQDADVARLLKREIKDLGKQLMESVKS